MLNKVNSSDSQIVGLEEVAGVLRREAAARWWEIALVLAAVFHVSATAQNASVSMWDEPQHLEAVMVKVKAIRQLVYEKYRIDGIIDMRPILPGHKIKGIFTKLPGGPMFGSLMKAQTTWMLAHWLPDATQREEQADELTTHLKTIYTEYL